MLLSIIFLCIATFPSVHPQYKYRAVYDFMLQGDKDRVRHLAHELVVEVNYKIHQIDDIRNMASKMIGFEIGMIMGQIKEKYKSMLEIFRQTNNKFTGASKIIMPSAEQKLPIHYFVRMEIIHGLQTDIDRLIHLLENIPAYKLKNLPAFG